MIDKAIKGSEMPILPEIPELRKFNVFGRESVNFSGNSSKFPELTIFSGKVPEETNKIAE